MTPQSQAQDSLIPNINGQSYHNDCNCDQGVNTSSKLAWADYVYVECKKESTQIDRI